MHQCVPPLGWLLSRTFTAAHCLGCDARYGRPLPFQSHLRTVSQDDRGPVSDPDLGPVPVYPQEAAGSYRKTSGFLL
jgi:hypothetical protein